MPADDRGVLIVELRLQARVDPNEAGPLSSRHTLLAQAADPERSLATNVCPDEFTARAALARDELPGDRGVDHWAP